MRPAWCDGGWSTTARLVLPGTARGAFPACFRVARASSGPIPPRGPPLSLHLPHLNDCVIISRALISSRQGGYMVHAAHAAAARATVPSSTRQFLIGRTAIRIARNSPENNAVNFSNRSKRACFGARFAPHNSPITTQKSAIASSHPRFPQFLIATQILEIELTRSQQTRKLFLIATFYGCLANASHLASFYFSRSVPNGAMRAVTFVRKNSPAFREAHISQHFDGRGPAALPHFCANIPKSNTFAHQRLSPRLRTNAQVTVE